MFNCRLYCYMNVSCMWLRIVLNGEAAVGVVEKCHKTRNIMSTRPTNNESSTQSEASCRKPYYRKRRYNCPGKRRYKAITRCCKNQQKITLCNRNWARISINPFINFLRCYKRQFPKKCPISYIAREGRKAWKRMTRTEKKPFYEQAKRARKRGFRT